MRSRRETKEGINLYYNENQGQGETENNTETGVFKDFGFGEMKGFEK